MLKASGLVYPNDRIIYQGGSEYLDRYLLIGQMLWVKHHSAPETVVVRNLRERTFALSTGSKLKYFKLYGGKTKIE